MPVRLLRFVVVTSCCAVCVAASAADTPLSGSRLLEGAERILFLGDSITYDGRYVAIFDAWLCAAHPEKRVEVLNLGLPSETVSGLSEAGHAGGRFPRPDLAERLERVLDATRPDLILACYGMNCGIYQPFSEVRFARYKAGIHRLREAAETRGARIVFLTPPAYDHQTGKHAAPDYNTAVLGAYADWLRAQRAAGWPVVSLHGPMSDEIARRRAGEPGFTFQPDGVHPNDTGHWFIARRLVRFFGGEANVAAPKNRPGVAPDLPALTHERMTLLRDAWLTKTGHKRPGLPKGLPLAEAQARAAALSHRIHRLATEPHRKRKAAQKP